MSAAAAPIPMIRRKPFWAGTATVPNGLHRCLPDLPADVQAERGDMARQLIVHMLAERERALAEGSRTPRSSWQDTATGLVDAIVGMWLAPVTR